MPLVAGREGSILIEVVVAIVLLAILMVPLAGGILSAVGRADTVRQQAARLADALPGEAALQAWSWGSKVASAWWRPGPTLYVRPERSGDQLPTVGLWVDGWFLGRGESRCRRSPSFGRGDLVDRTPEPSW